MPPTKLAEWLQKNMDERNWGVRETARRAHVSHPTISDVLNGGAVSFDTCRALAKLFGVKVDFVLRLAGLLEPVQDSSETIEEIVNMTMELPEDDQEEVLQFIKMRIRIAEERGKVRVGEKNKRRSTTPGSD